MMNYKDFIASKKPKDRSFGFDVTIDQINQNLFFWQKKIVQWSINRGRAALFEDCGLGKTLQQLEWAHQVCKRSGPGATVVIHCPVGVRSQTKAEAEKFKIQTPVTVCNTRDEIQPGINLINYEKIHLFDGIQWQGVVLDESSILKSFTGKTKRHLIDAYARTPYRLACTATPAPNDYMELGNHAEFLGVLDSNDMLSRWFINDTMKAGGYRLRGHAIKDFWKWVSSWAVCLEKPADIGGDNTGYDLPELITTEHIVDAPNEPPAGFLFDIGNLSATTMHDEKKRSADQRAKLAAELIDKEPHEPWLVWCDTNYESDALLEHLPEDATEVRGSEKDTVKESKLLGFGRGEFRILVTKPEIAGFGLNFQHCARVIFVGLSFSYERYYQAIRRSYRFGQTRPVHVHLINTPAEEAMKKTVMAKQAAHEQMRASMADSIRGDQLREVLGELTRAEYQPAKRMELPEFLSRSVAV